MQTLRAGEKRLNAGEELDLVLRQLEIAESTWNRRRNSDGGTKAANVNELMVLGVENVGLKKLTRTRMLMTTSASRRCARSARLWFRCNRTAAHASRRPRRNG